MRILTAQIKMVHNGGTYLTLNQKLTYFFYYYSFEIDGNKSVIQKVLFGIERMTRTDSKITLAKIKFSMNTCKHLNKAEVDNFSDTARDFFCFIQSFENKLKVRDFVDLQMVEDSIQSLDMVTCGKFQIYFYDNLSNPDVNTKIQNNKKLTKKKLKRC